MYNLNKRHLVVQSSDLAPGASKAKILANVWIEMFVVSLQ